ncbi:hypothetical protein [Streptomyces sp. NPDC085479]|uniref:hypothetical protein n=1 Tax=Streptomyces sp. NPDC085479 TaxID=3365726 RepID=UPI0037D86F9F
MKFVNSSTHTSRRLAAGVLIAAGLTGSLVACGSSHPPAMPARAAAPAPIATALPGGSTSTPTPQPSQSLQSQPSQQSPTLSQAEHAAQTDQTGRAEPNGRTRQPPQDLRTPQATAPAAPRTRTEPPRTTPTTHPVPTATQQRLSEGRLTVRDAAELTARITGLPAAPRLVSGGAPVEFSVTLRNTGDTDFPLIAPVVRFDQYDGGLAPLGSVAGRLERLDPVSGAWQPAPLPQATGMDYLLAATGGAPLPKGATTTIRYRVALAAGLGAGATELQVYAVSQPSNQQAGKAVAKVTIAP